MIIDTSNPDEANPHQEPCQWCGEETAVGSSLFFDRHTVDDPEMGRYFVCSLCVAQSRRKCGAKMDSPMSGVAMSGLGAAFGLR